VSSLPVQSPTGRSVPQRRGRLGWAAAALLTVPLAAGCGAGSDAASLRVEPNSGAGTVGNLAINNVWVVVDPTSGNAEVLGAITNNGGADQLTSVQAAGSPATFRPPASTATTTALSQGVTTTAGSVSVGAGSFVSFGQPGSPELEIPDSTVTPGTNVQVTFTFASAGSVSITALVQPNTGLFGEYNPNPATPTPSPIPVLPTGTLKPTATGTTTASPSTSAKTSTPLGTPITSASPSPSSSH
jgi:hypothetical protein